MITTCTNNLATTARQQTTLAPAFIRKLYQFVGKNPQHLSWDTEGSGIIVRTNASNLAPLLKTSGLGSYPVFQKNLELYFQKTNNVYSNKFFQKGHPSMLSNIAAKKMAKKASKRARAVPPPQSFEKAAPSQNLKFEEKTSYTNSYTNSYTTSCPSYSKGSSSPCNLYADQASFSTSDISSNTDASSEYTSQTYDSLSSASYDENNTGSLTGGLTGFTSYTSACDDFSTMSESSPAEYSSTIDEGELQDEWMDDFTGLLDDVGMDNMLSESTDCEAANSVNKNNSVDKNAPIAWEGSMDQLDELIDNLPDEKQSESFPTAVAFPAPAFAHQLPEAKVNSPPTAIALAPGVGKQVITAVAVQSERGQLGTQDEFDLSTCFDDEAGDSTWDLSPRSLQQLPLARSDSSYMDDFDPTQPLEESFAHRSGSGGVLGQDDVVSGKRDGDAKRPYSSILYQGACPQPNAKRMKSGTGGALSAKLSTHSTLNYTQMMQHCPSTAAAVDIRIIPSPRCVSQPHHAVSAEPWVNSLGPRPAFTRRAPPSRQR
jgi:hypothetical protein